MAEGRRCLVCGVSLAGPFLPQIGLAQAFPAEEGSAEPQVLAYSWVCPECGLVHWYAVEQEPEAEETEDPPAAAPRAAASYERRSEIVRMLRRVKRM